ncbi:MAG: molecular chaperone TorD family protein [Magnetospirillum sp.]|nr:molecular chaperone TorD family protein [Magnetospirillum sp.]
MRAVTAHQGIAEDDFLRARFYGLMAALLAAPPPEDLLRRLGCLSSDPTPLGVALGELAELAKVTDADGAATEFATLFIGVTGGELIPYGSWYLTGFLNEKPLAELRQDMLRLGIERSPGISEPEDHAASLCEMMQGLITGLFDQPLPLPAQKAFFQAHVESWMPRFLTDLENASSARFYRAVGRIGRVFLNIETQAFEMVD